MGQEMKVWKGEEIDRVGEEDDLEVRVVIDGGYETT